MKPVLKLKFVDFWTDLNKSDDNYFYELLSETYQIEFSDNPDVLFYSCYGNAHRSYGCTRIFYSPENHRPDFSKCDYAITFDYLDDPRHVRMPLWALYYISYSRKDLSQKYLALDAEERLQQWLGRKHFCCMMVASDFAKERIVFFNQLNDKKTVDSAGKWNNTIGREIAPGTENKFEFIKDYRFVISFENASHAGYTTEKIVEPMMAGCIPIYWGDPNISTEFNAGRFIHVKGAEDYNSAIDTILSVNSDSQKAKDILSKSFFAHEQLPSCLDHGHLREPLNRWVEEAGKKKYKGVGSKPSEKIKYYSDLSLNMVRKVKQWIR